MWMNEYQADFLARDRLAEAREKAARRALVESLCRGRRHSQTEGSSASLTPKRSATDS